jgi:hypothetical protein
MKTIYLGLAAALAITLASCSDSVVPFENPTQQNMQFKTGASYTSRTTVTNPEDSSSTTTERHWTLVNPSTTLYGRGNVAVWIDSVFTAGGIFNVADSILLQQLPGNNDVYRYAQLLPEITVPSAFGLNLTEGWKQEAKLNASTSSWDVAEIADTIPAAALGIPPGVVTGVKIAISDRAQAAGTEAVMIGSQSYMTTKTIHTIKISASALTSIGFPVEALSESVTRTTWTSADLGAIIKEEREGKVLRVNVSSQSYKLFPIPAYKSAVTAIVSTGN